MAKRPGDKPLFLRPNARAAFRDKHLGLHGGFVAFSRSLVLICLALSGGYCGAETEFSILEEAQVLAEQMKKLSSQELGVFTMQVKKKKKTKLFEVTAVCVCVFGSNDNLRSTELERV